MDTVPKAIMKRLVTSEWRANLNALRVGGYFFIRKMNRRNITNDTSTHFKERTNKRFKVSMEGAPSGYLRVSRLPDEVLEQVA